MNITLISPVVSDLGISTIAPLLKREGHKVRLLFIPEIMQSWSPPPSAKTVDSLKHFLRDADLVGINSFTENYPRTVSLLQSIKSDIKAPVIWGGIHATLRPQDCIRYADFVCVGEGERAVVEFAGKLEKGGSVSAVKNILDASHYDAGRAIDLYDPVDLDSLLPLDYDLSTQYILSGSRISNIDEPYLKGIFCTFSARGCPFRCTYCCSATMQKIYDGRKVWRQRSLDKAIDDLKSLKSRFASCRHIWFNEADFISGKAEKDIEDFSVKYKSRVGIPFSIWSNPASVTDEAIGALKEAGLMGINIGTVHGSRAVQGDIYKRNAAPDLYRRAGAILVKHGIRTEYDFILCNPYESEEDIISTIKLLMDIPKPFKTVIYRLTYFPETELYARALKDGHIKEKDNVLTYTKASYSVWKFRGENEYLYIVASLMRGWARKRIFGRVMFYGALPENVLRFLITKPVINFMKKMPFRHAIYQLMAFLVISSFVIFGKLSGIVNNLKRIKR
ncbi:MAG: radical SAM protein [Candidatus Omnitrophota bacterium]